MSSEKDPTRIQTLQAAKARAEQREQWAWDNQAEIYQERDLLLGMLARVYPSHLMYNKRISSKLVLCIHTPAGQLAWTIHSASESLRQAVAHLPVTENDWDGARTAQRRDRLRLLASQYWPLMTPVQLPKPLCKQIQPESLSNSL